MRISGVVVWGLLASAAAGPAVADCYKVGPGGTHAALQPAVNAALAAGGLDCIRVAAGYRAERLNLPDLLAGRTLTISGGWDGAFAVQTGTTTLDGAGMAPVVHVFTRSGILSLSRFRVVNGNTFTLGTPTGGGLRLTLQGPAAVQIDDCEVLNNRLSGENGAGGGLWADVGGTAVLGIVRTRFAGNAVHAPIGQAFGGGAHILASDDSRLVVAESHFLNNEVSGSEYTEAAALDIFVGKNARADVTDNTALGNRTLSMSGDAWGTVHLQAGRVDSADTAQIVARRNRIQQNVVQRTDGHQLELRTTGATLLWVTDTLVSNSSGTGILAWPNGGTMYLTNLTVTRQGADGLRVIGGAETVFLTSSILFGNGTDLDGAAQLRSNLVGVDPLFLDPATRDYHLAPGSPAIDAGASSTPGDLGPLDLDRLARVHGWRVDQGAYETSAGPRRKRRPRVPRARAGHPRAAFLRCLPLPHRRQPARVPLRLLHARSLRGDPLPVRGPSRAAAAGGVDDRSLDEPGQRRLRHALGGPHRRPVEEPDLARSLGPRAEARPAGGGAVPGRRTPGNAHAAARDAQLPAADGPAAWSDRGGRGAAGAAGAVIRHGSLPTGLPWNHNRRGSRSCPGR